MGRLINLEFKRAFKSRDFYIGLIITMILMLIAIYPYINWQDEQSYDYVIAWFRGIGMGKAYIALFFPILVSIPYSSMLAVEKKYNYFKYILLRTDRNKYLISKGIVNSIYGGLVLFIPSIILLIICISIFPNPSYFLENQLNFDDPFSIILKFNPILYIFINSLWMFFQGMIWSTVCYSISLICKNILVITVVPFLYSILSNFLLAIMNLASLTPPSSFAPYLMSNTTIFTMMFQPTILILFIFCIIIYYTKSGVEKYD